MFERSQITCYHVITSRMTHETTARDEVEERRPVSFHPTCRRRRSTREGVRASTYRAGTRRQVASRDAERPWTAGRARTAARRDAPPRAGGAGRFVPRYVSSAVAGPVSASPAPRSHSALRSDTPAPISPCPADAPSECSAPARAG